MGLLDGKVAVITGAGSGMGKMSTKVFVREGAKVLAADISGAEKTTNPFLRAGEPAVARSVGKEGADPATVFQALREWKNRF